MTELTIDDCFADFRQHGDGMKQKHADYLKEQGLMQQVVVKVHSLSGLFKASEQFREGKPVEKPESFTANPHYIFTPTGAKAYAKHIRENPLL